MDRNKEIGKTRSGLRYGYTTGSCAAAATKAAVQMLLSGEEIHQVQLMTPKGILLYLDVEEISMTPTSVCCAIRKYSGDDPDVTDGILIFSTVEKSDSFSLDGGLGVGRVTRLGLEQKIGMPAINKVPRRMIQEAVEEICKIYAYTGGVKVQISVPEGLHLAKKTFNPRLGIEGGISILGTSGIVEPMSEKALTDTIYIEMKVQKENGCSLCCVVPGNYGIEFLQGELGMNLDTAVKCSNYIGETIDYAKLLGIKKLLLIGHVGKFIKLAAGVMNTHSRQADCRMEVLASHAAMAGAKKESICKLMQCINTNEAIEILKEEQILQQVMNTIMDRMQFYLKNRAGEELEIGAIMFSMEDGILGMTKDAQGLWEQVKEGKK